MVRIYGCSDDLVEVEGSTYYEDEIGCFDSNVRIWFDDGTVVLVGYPKLGQAVWWINVENEGTATMVVSRCDDEDAPIYSDVLEIEAEIVKHEVVMC